MISHPPAHTTMFLSQKVAQLGCTGEEVIFNVTHLVSTKTGAGVVGLGFWFTLFLSRSQTREKNSSQSIPGKGTNEEGVSTPHTPQLKASAMDAPSMAGWEKRREECVSKTPSARQFAE